MNDLTRRQIFKRELEKLHDQDYITTEEYIKVSEAHKKYLIAQDQLIEETPIKAVKRPQPKPKRVLSAQEIRDRNITWILILGVIMVLTAGLVLATSNWERLDNTAKTLGISLIAMLFFGISWLCEKKLKINQTGFAFWVLGSLFVPVAIISAGYFKLFGKYFSVFGDGKYLLGVLGSCICLPLYFYSANKYNNRLYTWFFFITLTFGVAFVIAAFYPTVDLFYLGMIIYNSLLLVGYMKGKGKEKYSLFINELPWFIQVNLLVSTLLMLTFYSNQVFYGFNVIFTAIIYFFMVFVKGNKENIYVFGGLLVYGLFQVIENSPLASLDYVLFSLIGFIFLIINHYLKLEESLQQIFNLLSGFVSLTAFIYISYEGLMLGRETPTFLLFVAYLLIAVNYIYLAYKTKNLIYCFMAPAFLVSAAWQSYELVKHLLAPDVFPLYMFAVALGLFFALYIGNNSRYLQPLRKSSMAISIMLMLYCISFAILNFYWLITSSLAFIFGIVAFLIFKAKERLEVREIAAWVTPISWGLALLALVFRIDIFNTINGILIHLALIGLVLIIISYLAKRSKEPQLEKTFFWVGQVFLLIGILPLDKLSYPLIYLLATFIYCYSLWQSKDEALTKLFLYSSFTTFTVVLLSSSYLYLWKQVELMHIMFLGSILISTLWHFVANPWQQRILLYLIPYSVIAILGFIYFGSGQLLDLTLALVQSALVLYVIYRIKLPVLNSFILLLVLIILGELGNLLAKKIEVLMLYSLAAILLKGIGEFISKKLYDLKINFVDFYAMASFILIFLSFYLTLLNPDPLLYKLIPSVLFMYLLYSQIKRVEGDGERKIFVALTLGSVLVPYYIILDHLKVPSLVESELILLPWLVLVIILSARVWKSQKVAMGRVELGVLLIIAIILLRDVLLAEAIYEGLILGALALVSVVAGNYFKKKSFFLTGLGTIALNSLIQTKDFWGNIPWWGYLLGAGLILIGVASLNEIDKNKDKRLIQRNKEKIFNHFKEWR